MISVEKAKELVISNAFQLEEIEKNISECLNCVLSKEIVSPISFPPFDQSSMDGFALRFSDFKKTIPIEIIGESAGGIPFNETLKEGEAIRIFTGAKIPTGADTIVIQENVFVENRKLIVNDTSLVLGSNCRSAGSQIKKGDVVLKKTQIINPGTIGLLASLGINKVNVYASPRVSIIVTGNELTKPGNALNDGQVYESNSYFLNAAFESINIKNIEIISVSDDENNIAEKLKSAIENSDLVLTTGGISVGKYDFVSSALQKIGVQNIFYKVSQKPGKPLYFGKLNSCLIFGLPGNQASSLTCFYEYVFPAVKIMQGFQNIFLQKQLLPIVNNTLANEKLSLFLKGKISNDNVEILQGQESSNISSFSAADCLVYLPEQKRNISAGELVEVHFLPQAQNIFTNEKIFL